MLDLLGGGIFGSLLGGLFRLAPEVLKWMDKKNERSHELKMFEQQCQLETLRGNQKLVCICSSGGNVLDFVPVELCPCLVCVDCLGGWCATRGGV